MVFDDVRNRVWAVLEKEICVLDVTTGNKVTSLDKMVNKICSIAFIEDKIWTGADNETLSVS
jgi:hypothetical protein